MPDNESPRQEHCVAIVNEGGKPVKVMNGGIISTVLVCTQPAVPGDIVCTQHQRGTQ